MSKGRVLRVLMVAACTAPLGGCMGGMMGMGGQPRNQTAQANDSGVGSTAGSVAGSQMSDQVPFGSEIGGFLGRRTEKAVRGQGQKQSTAQPAGATQTP